MESDFKVLFVGEFYWDIYEKAFYNASVDMGYKTYKFECKKFFRSKSFVGNLFKKAQYKYRFGPTIAKLNNELISYCEKVKPNLVFIYRGAHIFPSTVKKLRSKNIIVFGYNNDDPFSSRYPKYFWRHYINCTEYYNHVFVYRKKNIEDYGKMEYHNTSLLRSYYMRNKNFEISDDCIHSDDKVDIVYVGHFEDDGRDEYLLSLKETGLKVKIYGDVESWSKSKLYQDIMLAYGAIRPARDNYNLVLNSASIAICFLSKLNNDSYTRRCFEIPATGTMMLSEYTDDLATLYVEDEEIVFFKSKSDFKNKCELYVSEKYLRESIARNGLQKVKNAGHDEYSRVKEIFEVYESISYKNRVVE